MRGFKYLNVDEAKKTENMEEEEKNGGGGVGEKCFWQSHKSFYNNM